MSCRLGFSSPASITIINCHHDDNLDYKDTSDTICHRHCAGGDCDDKEDDDR